MQVVNDLNGDRVDLLDLSPDEWVEIHAKHVPMRCRGCGELAYPREQPYPVQLPGGQVEIRLVPMFCHYPGAAEKCRELGYEPETVEHAAVKQAVAAAVERTGRRARFEVIHDDGCRSDVVASDRRTGREDGFEVQVSPQSVDNAVARHERYEAHLDAATWLHQGERQWARQVPALQAGEGWKAVVGGIVTLPDWVLAEPMPLNEVVPKVLDEEIRYVYDGEVGAFIPRPEAKIAPRYDRKRKPAQYRGAGSRFCDRDTAHGRPSDWAVIDAGFTSIGEFQSHYRAGKLRADRGGTLPDQMEPKQYRALILAARFPELTTADSDRLANIGFRLGGRIT